MNNIEQSIKFKKGRSEILFVDFLIEDLDILCEKFYEDEEERNNISMIYKNACSGNQEARKEFMLYYLEKLNLILEEYPSTDELNEMLISKMLDQTKLCIDSECNDFEKAEECLVTTLCGIKDVINNDNQNDYVNIRTTHKSIEDVDNTILLNQIIAEAGLSETEKMILSQEFVDGYTPNEISANLSLSKRQVKFNHDQSIMKLQKTYRENFKF